MPNTRRRKFSVQNDLICTLPGQKNTPRFKPNKPDSKRKKPQAFNEPTARLTKSNQSATGELGENDEGPSGYSFVTKVTTTKTVDQEVEATFSTIDLVDRVSSYGSSSAKLKKPIIDEIKNIQPPPLKRKVARQDSSLASRRVKVRRQHCTIVRTPKRDVSFAKINVALSAISLRGLGGGSSSRQAESQCSIQLQPSSSSLDVMCRICHGGEQLSQELGALVAACACRGTVGRVHVRCLEHWLTESGKSRCELCGTKYATRRVHKYGLPKALFMWLVSQNAKQLIVDSLGIVLMSPLAILAAWLSGRTLAGLMEQESHVTPWPLASTFVLACMTLVCYYCWIVSAASRHALGWWLWYRAQYEVRLEIGVEEANESCP